MFQFFSISCKFVGKSSLKVITENSFYEQTDRSVGQKPSLTKAVPLKSDKADKSPPVKMTRQTKALP
jgi:hypothetical protein